MVRLNSQKHLVMCAMAPLFLRTQLAAFTEDWESPEMNVYDNYDEAKSDPQTR